jgi:hypothetical protein
MDAAIESAARASELRVIDVKLQGLAAYVERVQIEGAG